MVAIIVLAGSLEETILYSEYSLNRRKSVAITKMTVFSFIRVLFEFTLSFIFKLLTLGYLKPAILIATKKKGRVGRIWDKNWSNHESESNPSRIRVSDSKPWLELEIDSNSDSIRDSGSKKKPSLIESSHWLGFDSELASQTRIRFTPSLHRPLPPLPLFIPSWTSSMTFYIKVSHFEIGKKLGGDVK